MADQEHRVVIYGAGGFGREVLWIVRDINSQNLADQWEVIGFADDDPTQRGMTICGVSVLGSIEKICQTMDAFACVCGLGEPSVKAIAVPRLRDHVSNFPSIIHPSVQLSDYVDIQEGCVVCANAVLTTQVELQSFVTVNLGCTIGHDVIVGEFSTLAPGVHVSGGVCIGPRVKLGTGAIVLPGVSIGAGTTVGAGAVVTKDLPSNVVAIGVPAKIVRAKERQE